MIGFKYVLLSFCIIELIVGFRDDLFTDSDFDEDDYDSENSLSDALFDLAGDVLTTGAHMFSSFMKEVGEQFERCEFSCPNLKKPKHRENYEPTFNGCGSYGYTINLLPGFTACCNVHDICYGTCNKRKLDCDAKFKKCLLSVCNDNALSSIEDLKDIISACNSTATLMYDLVIKFGCPAYGSSQKLACDCS